MPHRCAVISRFVGGSQRQPTNQVKGTRDGSGFRNAWWMFAPLPDPGEQVRVTGTVADAMPFVAQRTEQLPSDLDSGWLANALGSERRALGQSSSGDPERTPRARQ